MTRNCDNPFFLLHGKRLRPQENGNHKHQGGPPIFHDAPPAAHSNIGVRCYELRLPDHSRASSTAVCAARIALFLINAILASRLRPPVNSTTRCKRNGVASFLPTPCSFASATALAIRSSTARSSIAKVS